MLNDKDENGFDLLSAEDMADLALCIFEELDHTRRNEKMTESEKAIITIGSQPKGTSPAEMLPS